MPTQGVFRQKPWLPWWLIPLLLLLLLLLFLFLRSQPQNVLVPKVVGEKSTFDGREDADRGRPQARPEQEGTGRRQGHGRHDPRADAEGGREGREGHAGGGPGRRRHRQAQRARTSSARPRATPTRRCATKELTLGQASPQPVDPKGKIVSQIPAAGEIVKAGTPVNIFYADPADADNKKKQKDKDEGQGRRCRRRRWRRRWRRRRRRRPRTSSSPRSARTTSTPTPRRSPTSASSRWSRKEFNDAPKGTLFATDPPGGTKVAAEVEGDAARLRRPAAGRLHQRQEHPARQRRQRRQARPGRRPARTRRRTRPGPPTASTSPTRPTAA